MSREIYGELAQEPSHRVAVPAPLSPVCQRWNRRRTSYRPTGEIFDPSRAGVEPITDAQAKAFVETHHYSGSYPAARFRAGIFVKEPFRAPRLAGVGVFSVSMTQAVIPAYFEDLQPSEGVELGRLVLLDELAANAESWFIARAQRLLRAELKDVRGVVAYCDPVERVDADGRQTKRGHTGLIYRATNALYRGRSSPRTLWLAPSGMCLADRMLSKIRRGETGERYALEKLHSLGAPRRFSGEDGAAYVARLKECGWLRPLKHPGNLVYTWRMR